jgi:hypothetical protein
MKLGFSLQIFEKYSNIKFNKILPMETKFHADGRDEANSRFSQLCERA